ncbi:MAG: hypothetical protein M3R55_02965 [Acidobacteriota bacterium]|nr:hypothetical protein [Acidobacteriota bacterium]
MKWFMAAALSVAVFLAMLRSVVAPVIGPSGLEYLFLAPSSSELLWLAAAAAASTLALRLWALGVAARFGETRRAREGRWLAPLCLLSLAAAPLVVFLPGLARAGSPFVFLGTDLRGWLALAALSLLLRELDSLSHGRLFRPFRFRGGWSGAARLLAWDTLVFAAVIAWAVATQPTMRFVGAPHGDEPKYLRYAENWYQGLGFDLTAKQRMSDMRLDAPSHALRNLALAGGALGEETVNLARDAGSFAQAPGTFRWNRARGGENWFFNGKHGGLYQVHTPGLSAVMFPGYYLDRHLLDLHSGHQGEVPGGLFMTNLTLLLIYAVWAVVLFRLLRRLLSNETMAAGLACLAMVTLPLTSFAFQMYPETAAGAALTGVLLFLLFPRAGAPWLRAAAFGALCGLLPWFHIRFSLVSLVAIVYVLTPMAGEWRQRRAFLAGYAAVIALMCAYAYRLTGSAMPNAMFAAEGTADSFDETLIPQYFAGYLVDRIWGILPHVPVYLLAFAGFGPLWRANRAHALLLAAMYLSLAVPAAAHSLNAAGATPGRHLVAVIPLMVWPLALAARAWWGSRLFRAAFASLTLLSLQASLAYNLWHTKDTGRMWDVSISGWKTNLLFAWTHGDVWAQSRGNFTLFLIGAGVIVALIAAGFLRRGRGTAHSRVGAASLAAGLIVIAAAGTGAAALTGDAHRDDYTQDSISSRRAALTRLADLDRCVFCAASGRGHVDGATLTWNTLEKLDVFVDVDARRTAHLRVFATSKNGEPAYGRVRITYGDGSFSPATPVAGLRRLTHRYESAGVYRVTAQLTMPDGAKHETYTEIEVR